MITFSRRGVVLGLSILPALPVRAADIWPRRPIVLIHGFPPGGPVDVLSRLLAEPLSRELGQSVVVEAKPGATGTTAAALVARGQPDGYTLLAVPGTFTATAAMLKSLPYNPIEDFTFISTTAEYPLVMVTHPDSGMQTLADVVRGARSRNAPLQYGTAGVGSIMHLSMERFASQANIRLQHIPYKGGMPALIDLLGKRLDLVLDPPTALVQFVIDNRLRALTVTGADRFFALPHVPTMTEAGFLGFVVAVYQGIAGPARLPTDIVTRLNRAIAVILADPILREKMRNVGNNPAPSSADAYKARVVADTALWRRVVEDAHIARI